VNAITPVAKLGKLIGLFGSDQDGEVLGAVRAAGRALKANGLDWHDLATALEREPRIVVIRETLPERYSYRPPPHWRPQRDDAGLLAMAKWLLEQDQEPLTDREGSFVKNMFEQLAWTRSRPTEKQAMWLRALYAKLRRESSP